MHPLVHPFLAAAAPAHGPSDVVMFLFYITTVPSFIMVAIEGKAIGWGVFQFLWLALGIWQFWRWTDGTRNGLRLIGIYVVYACLNLTSVLIYLIVGNATHGAPFVAWPVIALAIAAIIVVMIVRIIRDYPDSGK